MIFGVQYNKKECSLALDIGTEAVKAVVFEKTDHRYNILSSVLEYFDELRPFDNDKVILKTKEEAIRLSGKSPKELLLSLAPSILKTSVGKLKKKWQGYLFKITESCPKILSLLTGKFWKSKLTVMKFRVFSDTAGEIWNLRF